MNRMIAGPVRAAAAAFLLLGPALAAGATNRVAMKAIAFDPQQIRVHVGDVVEWQNQDIVAHTATAKDRAWDVAVPPGRAARTVMKVPGTFDYICRYHPTMTGQVIVEP